MSIRGTGSPLLTFKEGDIELGLVEAEQVFIKLLFDLVVDLTGKDHFYLIQILCLLIALSHPHGVLGFWGFVVFDVFL